MSETIPSQEFSVKLLAGIGNVCLQWSLLEHNLLYIIYAIEDLPWEKGEIMFGGCDMLPRLNMAINLAKHANIPKRFQKRLRDLRDTMRNEDLYNRRNRVVHGAQREGGSPGTVTFHMARIGGEKKAEDLTPWEIALLGNRIHEVSQEAWSLYHDIGVWKSDKHGAEDASDHLASGRSLRVFEIAKRAYARLKHLFS